MSERLDDEGMYRLLTAVVLHWWRECDDPCELAAFLNLPVDVIVSKRPLRIDGWRRKQLVDQRVEGDEGDDDDVC